MNTQHPEQPITEYEINLEVEGFRQHMKQKQIDIERDILIAEIAKRLDSESAFCDKLSDELRFTTFMNHCENYGHDAMKFLYAKNKSK